MILRTILTAALLLAATAANADVGQTRIVVPAHDINRGDVIGDSDLSYIAVAALPAVSGIVTSMDTLDGMQARRLLRAGEPLRDDDVRRPVLIAKGSTVTMTFDAPGVTLTAIGKAMSEGGLGETVTILNPVSYRQITGIVTGSGQVRAADATPVALSQQLAATR
jgi:flagella basal body P-ring formation protein FlgA